MKRIAIVAALPGELTPLVRNWDYEPLPGGIHVWRNRGGGTPAAFDLIAACAGMGASPALRALNAIEEKSSVTCLCSVGWAGALRDGLPPGSAHRVAAVIDAQNGACFTAGPTLKTDKIKISSGHASGNPSAGKADRAATTRPPIVEATPSSPSGPRLVSTAGVADIAEKRRLAEVFGSDLVDMEAAALARAAAERNIPFFALKAVSDGPAESLPDFAPFIDSQGHFHTVRFALRAALRPTLWPALLRLGRNSRAAARSLAAAFPSLLAEMSLFGPAVER